MLILTRRHLEAVVLVLPDGLRVRVSIRRIEGDVVRLAIEAPGVVDVWPEELGPPPAGSRPRVPRIVFPCPSCGRLLVELPNGSRYLPGRPRRFTCPECRLLFERDGSGGLSPSEP